MMSDVFVFVTGLCLGSFFACQIDRIKNKWSLRDIMMEPSKCFSCGGTLKWWNNIPVFSYLWQRGKCSVCGARIPAYLPVVELAVAILAVVLYHLIQWAFNVA